MAGIRVECCTELTLLPAPTRLLYQILLSISTHALTLPALQLIAPQADGRRADTLPPAPLCGVLHKRPPHIPRARRVLRKGLPWEEEGEAPVRIIHMHSGPREATPPTGQLYSRSWVQVHLIIINTSTNTSSHNRISHTQRLGRRSSPPSDSQSQGGGMSDGAGSAGGSGAAERGGGKRTRHREKEKEKEKKKKKRKNGEDWDDRDMLEWNLDHSLSSAMKRLNSQVPQQVRRKPCLHHASSWGAHNAHNSPWTPHVQGDLYNENTLPKWLRDWRLDYNPRQGLLPVVMGVMGGLARRASSVKGVLCFSAVLFSFLSLLYLSSSPISLLPHTFLANTNNLLTRPPPIHRIPRPHPVPNPPAVQPIHPLPCSLPFPVCPALRLFLLPRELWERESSVWEDGNGAGV
ncbi:hypothetical protein CVT25_013372 [Psilocybe cyanescens]|uniref:Uncharacterized protein n=1 Tax=Psilocybe cyanescens TaxID=93625 RepID=A0A409WSH9_PSICY|nr:hypothetical protein CVT25_013372 [Psilocybe cyanescens]